MSAVRWPVLACTSMIAFSADYFYDVPAVLHDRFIYHAPSCFRESGREKCLHLSPAQYDLLYAVYAWFGACIVPFAGILADKLGSKGTLIGFGFLFPIGSTLVEAFLAVVYKVRPLFWTLFSCSTCVRDEETAFILMLLGRLVFGIGSASTGVIAARLQSFWFKDHEIGLAFAISIVAGCLGSVTNFLFTEAVADAVGLGTTLWLGTMLCGLGLVGAIGAGFLHVIGLQRLGKAESTENVESFQIGIIREFTWSFWILALFLVFFYAGVFPFVAEASRYFEDRFFYSQSTAGYVAGSMYDVALISPLFGYLSDRFGFRSLWVLLAPTLLFSGYVLFFFVPFFPPILFCVIMGLAFTIVAAIAWSCVPFLVPDSGVGTAMGLVTSVQMLGIGVSNAVLGELLSQSGKAKSAMWDDVMVFLGSCALAALLLAVVLNVLDWKTGQRLRGSQMPKVSMVDSAYFQSIEDDLETRYRLNADTVSCDESISRPLMA